MEGPDERCQRAFKIMLASDIHLGYNEKDKERGEDSFNAFEEILQHAVDKEVDFILLGGDLFHDANPSINSLNRCLKLLRIYCMGDKPIEFQFLSDQSVNFVQSLSQTVNFMDPNLNISIPLFSIHGNHDDPSGFGNLSSLDLLSTSGLVNYFGTWGDTGKVLIDPIMLQKGDTKVGIYGVSYVHDNRLCRLFDDGKVTISQPDDVNDWFNIFVVHQNRANRGAKNFLPEEALPAFANIVLWGHEHDCRIDPEKNLKRGFDVIQPGSSVATSLAEGEALEKHCAILYVDRGDYKLQKIPLRTVRPFVFKHLRVAEALEDVGEGAVQDKVWKLAKKRVQEMIKEAEKRLSGHDRQPKLPLIRLRLEVSEECQMFNAIRFGQDYVGVVANPLDMIHFQRKFQRVKSEVDFDKDIMEDAYNEAQKGRNAMNVEDVVTKYFEETSEKNRLKVMSVSAFHEMTRNMIKVEGSNDDKRKEIIDFYFEECVKHLDMAPKEQIPVKIEEFRTQDQKVFDGLLRELDKKGPRPGLSFLADEDDVKPPPKVTPAKAPGRGRGRGRGAASANTSASTRAKQASPPKRKTAASKAFDPAQKYPARNASSRAKGPIYTISDSD